MEGDRTLSVGTRLKKALKSIPMRCQVRGVRFLEERNGRGLIGDDMGIGKTLEVLGWLAIRPDARPVIIACPANAKYEWEGQIYEHTYLNCQVLSGEKPYAILSNIVIINYDIIPYWEKELIKMKAKVLVMDECHYIKTRKIKRTVICRKISRKSEHVIPMSGTPITNRPVEFFPVLNMIDPKEFSSFWKYAFRYCDPKRGWRGRGWDFTGASRTKELSRKLKPLMIRRLKSEVFKEMPKKRRIPIKVDLVNRKEYEEARDNFLGWYGKNYGKGKQKKAAKAIGFVKLGKLKQLAATGKFKAAVNWIDDFLSTTDEKLVVFCYHKLIFRMLIDKYKKIAAVGGKAGKARHEQVKKFQTNARCRLFLGTIKADKEAITLTAASTVLFLEQGWTPGEHDQAEDRINRYGQKARRILAYYLIAKDSIDEYVWKLIEKKRKIIAEILDGKESKLISERTIDIRRIVKEFNKVPKRRAA